MYLKSGSRLTFFLIFLHFLQKYRCVLKIGFSADISINIFIDIFIDISIDISIVIFIYMSIVIFIYISIVIFIDIHIDILTFIDKEEEEGVDLFLKSNDPTPEGGEKTETEFVFISFLLWVEDFALFNLKH